MFKRSCILLAALPAFVCAAIASDQTLPAGWHTVTAAPHRSLAEVTGGQAAPPALAAAGLPSGTGVVASSSRLRELAAALENDPIRMLEFVRNTIDYVPYYGQLKGADRTLLDQAGGDADQADLLVALLRSAGYEAGFVIGAMAMPVWSADDVDLSRWLGVAPWSVSACLDVNGIPYDPIATLTYDVYRVWARVWVGGVSYDLDPAFKRYKQEGVCDVRGLAGYEREAFLAAAGGFATNDYAQGLNMAAITNALMSLTAKLRQELRTNDPNASVESITGGRSIVVEAVESLAGQVPFPVSGAVYATNLPSTMNHPVRVTYTNLVFNGYMHQIAERGLTLRYATNATTTAAVTAPTTAAVSGEDLSLAVENERVPVAPSNGFQLLPSGLPMIQADPLPASDTNQPTPLVPLAASPSITTGSYTWYSPVKYQSEIKTGTIRLHNSGSQPLTLTALTLSGTDADKFQLVTTVTSNSPIYIASNTNRNFEIKYTTTTVGLHTNAAVGINFTYDGILYTAPGFFPLWGQTIANSYAQLWQGDTLVGERLAPMQTETLTIDIEHRYSVTNKTTATYPIKPGGTYAIITGFGSCGNGAILDERRKQVRTLREKGLANLAPEIMAESLHVIGQSWLQETALHSDLLGRMLGIRQVYHHRVGVAAQETGYYVDIKDQYTTMTDGGLGQSGAALKTGALFASAMEHGCLEQLQPSANEAVSTVKLLKIANDKNRKIYRATSNNWITVATALQAGGYTAAERAEFATAVRDRNAIVVLPQTNSVTLGNWGGKGYVQCESTGQQQSVAMIIGGDYHGGYGAYQGNLDISYQDLVLTVNSYDLAERNNPRAADPVDMVTGAYIFDHTDLTLDGPLPLALTRSYNAAQHNEKGPMGYGWTHAFNIYAQRHSAYAPALGSRSPDDVAAALVATMVAQDLVENADTPKGWVAAALTTQWAMETMTDNAVSIFIGQKALTFIEQPGGDFTPPPGVTATLALTNGVFVLQERHGNTYTFNNKLRLAKMRDPHGNALTFMYNAQTNLESVASSFGPKLSFVYISGLLTSVADNNKPTRKIKYQYGSKGNLTNVVDAASESWAIGYDDAHRVTLMRDPEKNVTIRNFYDSTGQVTNQISASGHPWNFHFTGYRNIVEDPLGNKTVYHIDRKQRTGSVESPNGARSYAIYDGQNHVIESIAPNQGTNLYFYDGNHNLAIQVNAFNSPEEALSVYTYDAAQHLISVTSALGTDEETVTAYTYTAGHRPDTVTVAKGTAEETVTDTDYLTNGLISRVSEGNGLRVTTYTYDANGNPDKVVSTGLGTNDYDYTLSGDLARQTLDGRITEYSYDARRLMTNMIDGRGTSAQATTKRSYWKNGLLKSVTDPRGKSTTSYWNAAYKPTGIILPNGGSITNRYDAADRLLASRDPAGNWTTNHYDSAGRIVAVASATALVTHGFDDMGNLTNAVVDPHGLALRTATTYDTLNRPLRIATALATAENQYDALGRITNRIDGAGKAWATQYDARGRVSKTLRPSGSFEAYAFNPLNSRTQFRNAEGHAMGFGTDAQGRVIGITNALGRVTQFGYSLRGNLAWRRDAANALTAYGHDALNRLVTITNAGVAVATFSYDANGNLTRAQNTNTTATFAYDAMNRMTVSTQAVATALSTVTNQYDLNGNRTNLVYPGGLRVGYRYGADNRLTGVTTRYAGQTNLFGFSYDTANRLTRIACPNGVSSTFGYDAEGRVTNIVHASTTAGGPFASRRIVRNALGFKEADGIDAGIVPTLPGMARSLRTHNAADQLVAESLQTGTTNWSQVAYGYNDNGGLQTVSSNGVVTQSFGYDYDQRLVSSTQGTQSIKYLLDASGARIGRVQGGVTNRFVVDYADGLKRPLAETTAQGTVTRYYVWSGAQLLCHIEADGTVRYYHADELGSTLALTDKNGAVTDDYAYMPYGYATHRGYAGSSQTPFQWLGGYGVYYDAATDLHLTLHRAYSSSLKRFLSPDPLGIDGGVNIYAMANLNPLFFVDPYGLSGLEGAAQAAGRFLANTFGNAEDIRNAWILASGADYSTAKGWMEGAVGGVGLATLTADAAFNLIPGKAAATTAAKTAVRNSIEFGVKALTRNADDIAQAAKRVPVNELPSSGGKFIVDAKGNTIPLKHGETVTSSPNGQWIQVRDAAGNPTGLRLDGPHPPRTHPDPRGQASHAHVPGVTNPDGTPWLPVNQ